MNSPNKMPPHLTSIKTRATHQILYLEPLIEEADDVMNAFMDRGYEPEIACTLTDITLARYDEKGQK